MNSFVFGRYIRRNSPLHNFDARVKFICFILFLICVFIKKSFLVYFALCGFLFICFLWAKLPWRILGFLLKILLIMTFFLFLFNLLISNIPPAKDFAFAILKENEIFHWKSFRLTYYAIIITLYYALRVTIVVWATIILVTTTRAVDLTNAIANILKPLRIIKFPNHIFAMIIVLTLRLVTTLVEEANSIMDAQASRGLDFYNGNIKVKIKALISLLIPLLISIFKRADEMALALEARGYNPYGKRTNYHRFVFRKSDYLLFTLFLIFFGLIVSYLFAFDWYDTVQANFVLDDVLNAKILNTGDAHVHTH